jgi:hypothetical protein
MILLHHDDDVLHLTHVTIGMSKQSAEAPQGQAQR